KAEMTRTETKNAISVATSGSESEEISNRASGPNSEPDNTNDATVAPANLTNAEISTPVPSGPGRNSQACSSYPASSNSLPLSSLNESVIMGGPKTEIPSQLLPASSPAENAEVSANASPATDAPKDEPVKNLLAKDLDDSSTKELLELANQPPG